MLMTKPETKPAMPAPRPLEGRTAIVTGSTSGIGLGIARALSVGGAKVMLNGFGEAGEIETIRTRLAEESGSEVRFDGAGMSRPAAIASIVEHTAAAFGKVDILVNNANQPGAVDSVDLDQGGCRLEIRQLGEEVVFRRLEPAEFDLRGFLAAGRPLEAAIAAELEYDRLFDAAMALSRLYGDGLVAGYAFAAIDIAQPTEALP